MCLTSSNADERIDSQLEGSQLRYLAPPKFEAAVPGSWTELERRSNFPGRRPGDGEPKEGDDIYLPGAGFAKKLYTIA